MATITTGITSESFGGNSNDGSESYELPAEIQHRAPGREAKNADPVKTAGPGNPLGPQMRPAPKPTHPRPAK